MLFYITFDYEEYTVNFEPIAAAQTNLHEAQSKIDQITQNGLSYKEFST